MSYHIPFNRPALVGNEQAYILQAITDGHASGDGAFTKKCHRFLEDAFGIHKALLTTNCTHALEMSALLLALQPGDEVIFPSFTFVSTVNAFALRGVQPIFADIRPDTMNIDETQLDRLISPRTRAIVVVHYAGVGCEMDTIMAIASRHDIPVIEDNAHGLFGKYKGRYLGTFGALATQSFHETKNFTCGEGGALLINDAQYVERAEIIREKGTNRSRFFRGQVDKYTWVDVGSSYLPSDLLAAYLYAQFEKREAIQNKRCSIWEYYAQHLADWANANDIQMPVIPAHCEQSYHMFYLIFSTLQQRQAFIQHMKDHHILTVFHYQPLHLSEMGQRYGGREGDCPVTERISDCLVRLPFYFDLTTEDLQLVVESALDFKGSL